MLLLAIPVGALIGLSLGALGGGGSILTVPALVYLLGQSPHGSTTASLIIVGVTSLAGMGAHLRAGRVQVRSGLVFGVLGAGGSYLGSRLSATIDPNALLAAFSVLIVLAAAAMLRRRRSEVPAGDGATAPAGAVPAAVSPLGSASVAVGYATPSSAARVGAAPAASGADGRRRSGRPARSSPARVLAAATVVGLLTGFFGVGGGFVVVPALVVALGFDMATAVGTSLLVIAINSASALVSRLSSPAHVDAKLLVVFTGAAVVGTLLGSRVASTTRPEKLVGAFALLLVAVAIYTGARSVGHLI
ncbi:sulfite exporter TauE/SafE family protein [Acidiferrimicrobium sp. IK]|uniref:sulfite exporter TauE/SafE family protein n=1 Tax=Acidiferrimicrobium sp. IK TaxID=2871700 RepID=UPI0021CB5DE7|nr:sulfite exporter TauE/SafE family protein [Acidiferrimicrobium sp. IK]